MVGDRRALGDEDWDSLVYSVKRGRCVVMLGPDAVRCTYAGQSLPVLVALTRFLQRRLEEENPYIDATFDRASAVAEAVIMAFRGDKEPLLEWVREFYAGCLSDDPVLDGVAALPVGLIVNTVPGLPAERAFEGIKPGHSVGFYDRQGETTRLLPTWSVDEPLIYHLYGSLDAPNSLVVSDRDLLDVLVAVIRDDPPLPSNLTSAFQDPDQTFLFLGFQLYHWQLRVLMHVLDKATARRGRSFALEVPTADLDRGTRNFYSSGHGIDFFDASPGEFVSALRARVESPVGSALAASPIAPDAPTIFICHASEDRDVADELSRRLRAAGLNAWLDKDDIRGGSDWDRLIQRTIQETAGYVVVLQSSHFAAKRAQESYVNKELHFALERQRSFPSSRTFVIPASIEAGADVLDPDLKHLQSIDLVDEGGFHRLVSLIKRDVERVNKLW